MDTPPLASDQTEAAPALPKAPSRRRAAFWSLLFSYGAMVLVLVRNLALVPLYLKYISAEEYGAWLATGGVLSYLTMADFGLMGLLVQQAAVAYGSGDAQRLGRTIGVGLRIAVALSLLMALAAAALAPFIPGTLGLEGAVATRLSYCFLIVGAANGLNLLSFATGGVLKSLQRTFSPGMLNLVSDALSIVATVVLVLQGWGLYAIAAGLALRSIVAVLGNAAVCLWVCYHHMSLRLGCRWSDTLAFGRLSFYQFIMRIGGTSISQLDGYLIGVILGPTTALAYVLTIRAHDLVRSLAGRFADALMPPLAHLHGEDNPARFREVTLLATRIQATLAILALTGVFAFNEPFMRLWVGSGVYVGDLTSFLIAVWSGSYLATATIWHALFAMGALSTMAWITWLEVLLKLPLLVGLLYALGIIGAPLATVAAHGAAVFALMVVAVRRIPLDTQQLRRLAERLMRMLAACALAALALVSTFEAPGTWSLFVLQVVGYLVLALLLAAVVDAEARRALLSRVWVAARLCRPGTSSMG